jgi:translocator protein
MSNSNKIVILQAGNIIAFIVTLAINGLANTSIFGGKNTGQISDQYPTLITPAGYVFAIWGIIYALLAIFVIYQAMPSQRNNPYQKQISALFILSSVFNIIWILVWQYNYITASVIPMLALLGTLAVVYLRLGTGKTNAATKEKAYVRLPFSVYFAWITVATFADVAAALSFAGWVTWTSADVIWGLIAAAILLVITLMVIATRKDIAYGLVVIWALVGIGVKQSAVPTIVYTAYIGALIVALTLTIAVWRSKQKAANN